MSHTIELKKVSKYYASEDSVSMGFSRLDLELDMGEFVAITGESGSGKSTLLNVISGLDTYEEGEMFVCGEDTAAYNVEDYERYRKTYIGNIFQDFNLVNSYSVYQNIELVMLLCGKAKAECKARITELIELVGLTEYTNTKASKLSGGQKQRVAIARALAKDAPIIVADEPTGNLDSESAALVMETLAKVSADKLVVIVTHNYEQAEKYVTRKLTMHDGKIIEDKMLECEYRKSKEAVFDPDDEKNVVVIDGEDVAAEDVDSVDAATEEIASDGETENPEVEDEAAEKIASDNETDEESVSESATPAYRDMGKGSEIRLGLRNTFNIPAKFMLLFIVYLFVATAVLGQYASTKSSLHEEDLLGYSTYFLNTDENRIVVTKQDESAFTADDIKKVEKTANIKKVFENDIAIDKGGSLNLPGAYVTGPIYPISEVKKKDLTYGHMPENDREIVISVDTSSDAYLNICDMKEKLIGEKVHICSLNGNEDAMTRKKVVVAGVIIKEEIDTAVNSSYTGYALIYVSDAVSEEITTSMLADSSTSELDYNGTRVDNDSMRVVYASDKVEKGEVYISELQSYYYTNAKATDKPLNITIDNRYFESKGEYTVAKVFTEKNIEELLGFTKDDYDTYSSCVFLNPKDFDKLFKKGNFQISAFMAKETESDDTVAALRKKGFDTLLVKNTLSDATGGFSFVIELIDYGRLILEFIILFFITYAVIKLIMKSRNSYYSTIRILGGTKKNTDNILRVELMLMMFIAYAVDIVFVLLNKFAVINIEQVSKLLNFLYIKDYIILAVFLLAMSALIAGRYSRKIFTKSAMNAYREEV